VPLHVFGYTSTIGRFGERFRDGQYSLVMQFLLFLLFFYSRCLRAISSQRHCMYCHQLTVFLLPVSVVNKSCVCVKCGIAPLQARSSVSFDVVDLSGKKTERVGRAPVSRDCSTDTK